MSEKNEFIQKSLRAAKLDGGLFYDFRGPRSHRPPHLARPRACDAAGSFCPCQGRPEKMVHNDFVLSRRSPNRWPLLPGDTLICPIKRKCGYSEKNLGRSEKRGNVQYSPKTTFRMF